MNWRASLSTEEAQEMYEDTCAAYSRGDIKQKEFFLHLAKLGYNATEIADAEKFYRPEPPENEDADQS
jgi:hypothetical protein